MAKFRMISDDLTGANANCSLMKGIGLKSASLLDLNGEIPWGMEAIAYTTNSRGYSPQRAYDAVKHAMLQLQDENTILYSKRIDSTLRGNLGSECQAMLDVLGEEYMAIGVPSYPKTGRVVVNGVMLVEGSLLSHTDAGRDTKAPVDSSVVEDIFKKQFSGKIRSVFLEDVEGPRENLLKVIRQSKEEGVKLLLFDAVTDIHLRKIAQTVLESGILFFAVDPGPFTMELANAILEQSNQLRKIIFTVGSVTDITKVQLSELLSEYPMAVLKVQTEHLIGEDAEKEVNRCVSKGRDLLEKDDLLLVTTTPFQSGQTRLNLKSLSQETGADIDEISWRISSGLASITGGIMKNDSFAGVFLSGGDITVAFAKELGATGIEIREEVIPLAAYGRFLGGSMPDLRVITKGGMVGDKNAMKLCLEKLRGKRNE